MEDEGETVVGAKFIKYWEDQGEDPFKHIPIVDVAVKVYEISRIFQTENCFHAKFCLQMDWEDPSLPISGDAIDFSQHFIPRFEINNPGEQIPVPQPGRTIKRKTTKGNKFRVAMTEIYRGDLLSRVDVSDFPYDIQLLEIVIKSRPCRPSPDAKKTYVELRDPVTFRAKEGESPHVFVVLGQPAHETRCHSPRCLPVALLCLKATRWWLERTGVHNGRFWELLEATCSPSPNRLLNDSMKLSLSFSHESVTVATYVNSVFSLCAGVVDFASTREYFDVDAAALPLYY